MFLVDSKAWYTHANQTVHEPNRTKQFMNQMRLGVDGTANMHCAIRKRFAYHSLRTKICRFFAQTQRELGELGGAGCPAFASDSRKINLPHP